MPKTTAVDNSINFYAPGSDDTGPGLNRGSGGGARGCGFSKSG